MNELFTPLPSDLDPVIPPLNLSGGLHSTSPRWRLPGSLTAPSLPTKLGRGFEGRGFINQLTMAYDPMQYPLHEICGTRMYRNMRTFVEGDPTPVFNEDLVVDYVLNTTPGSYAVTVTYTGDVLGYPSAFVGDGPDKATYYGPMDEHDKFPKIGYVSKFNEVAYEYLDIKLSYWLGEARAFRQATQGGLFWAADGAARSESPHGFYCYVAGMSISAKADLTLDVVSGVGIDAVTLTHGYDNPFIGRVALVKRKNGPFVRDFGPAPGYDESWGVSVYRAGTVTEELLNPITSNKWRDDVGTYTRRDASAFLNLGYRPLELNSSLLPNEEGHSYDLSSKLGFVSKDGTSYYRITLQAGHTPLDEFVPLFTQVILVVPGIVAEYMNALIEAMPSIVSLHRFFVDPADQARACYEAYREAWETTYDSTLHSWDELLAMPHKSALVSIWQATAKAAASVDPTLN